MKKIKLKDIDLGPVSFRFWTRTKRCGGCIEWQGACDSEGYGKFSIFHSGFRAHRVAYYLFHGVDPGQELVRHRCDNTRCVNPRHLLLGSQQENIADMDTRGRRGKVFLKGERSGRAVLTAKDVRKIRKSESSHAELARQYGVSRGCIQHVRNRLNWKHIK